MYGLGPKASEGYGNGPNLRIYYGIGPNEKSLHKGLFHTLGFLFRAISIVISPISIP